jgi:hypothetical protein
VEPFQVVIRLTLSDDELTCIAGHGESMTIVDSSQVPLLRGKPVSKNKKQCRFVTISCAGPPYVGPGASN